MDGSNKSAEGERLRGQEKRKQGEARGGRKRKSCTGYLYYSTFKSNALNPRCIGVPRTLQQVPCYIVGQTEGEASKDGRVLKEFYYSCLGYSVYSTGNDTPTDKRGAKAELPVCRLGFELLALKKASTGIAPAPASAHVPVPAPAHMQRREEVGDNPQPRLHKPDPSLGDDFLSRFGRSANLVASGVARNMLKVGSYMKGRLDDILFPYRRPPK